MERQTYRLRRLRDAGRAFPVLALLLWLVPLLWGMPGTDMRASSVLVYLFGTWAAVVVGAAILIGAQAAAERREAAAGRDGDAGGSG